MTLGHFVAWGNTSAEISSLVDPGLLRACWPRLPGESVLFPRGDAPFILTSPHSSGEGQFLFCFSLSGGFVPGQRGL